MQDIRWRAVWLSLPLVIVCLLLWAIADAATAFAVFAVGVLAYLAGHLYWLHKLLLWLRKPDLASMPSGAGVWEDVFAALHHDKRRHSRSQTQLSSALDRFRHAASALPDGVVLLDSSDKIEWCNTTAERQLGLNFAHDVGQPVAYLVRHSDFVHYLQEQDYSEPLKLRSARNPDITLEIQLVPFGSNQKLLLCRDISQLEKLEHMRRDFIANVSHELRTPLTVVGGFLESLMDMEGVIPEDVRHYFSMMQEQTSRMRHLVEDLLALSQLESSVSMPADSEVNIATLLDLVLHEAQGLSSGRHRLGLEVEPDLWLTGATQELHSAFGNLVSNAIRYTPEGGEIDIRWKSNGEEAVFSVRDTGIGIDPQHISRLTERFYRVDRSRSRETGGTGLGLSIVKHILARHQARLEIHSEPGLGSTFSVVFPQARVVRKTAQPQQINEA